MIQFAITQIGPIKHIEFDLNKFNVIIGPQSSGKSTIAKIISFCLWLEKDVLMHQSCDHINCDYIEEHLLVFHKLESYLNEGYALTFRGEVIDLSYSKDLCKVELKEGFEECKMGKNAYIPAERNVIALPNIIGLKMPENNVRSFIFDWLEIHQKYQKTDRMDILNLNLQYYYKDSSQQDTIVLPNEKEIRLEEASSGLQSIVPLYIYMHYLTHWIHEHKEDTSFKYQELFNEIISNELNKSIETTPHELLREKVLNKLASISRPHYSNIIIEEPELNLFPETQKQLVYDILKMISKGRDRIVMATHSPYLLYALNNCMLCFLAQNNIPEEDKDMQRLKESMIDPKDVSVWEIKDGEFMPYKDNPNHAIQDERGLIRNNYFDRIMRNIMADFSSLIDYADED